MMATNAFLLLSAFDWLGSVKSSDEQLVRISLPAGVSSLRLEPSFILPKSSPVEKIHNCNFSVVP